MGLVSEYCYLVIDGKLMSPATSMLQNPKRAGSTRRMGALSVLKLGSGEYAYWMTSWRDGGKVRNVSLGSCEKLSRENALQDKSRKMEGWELETNIAIPQSPNGRA